MNVEKRIHMHKQGRELLRSGQYIKSKLILEEALSQHGSHVLLLSDLSCCYYMLEDSPAWRKTVSALKTELKSQSQLNFTNRFYATITLAQNLEELGDISEALQIYNNLKRETYSQGGSPEILFLLSQLVRVKSQFFIPQMPIPELTELTTFSSRSSELNLHADVQHALLIYELRRTGELTANLRLKSIIDRTDYLNTTDRCLFILDYCETLMRMGGHPSQQLKKFIANEPHAHLGRYGLLLNSLVNSDKLSWTDFYQQILQQSLSPANRLRLLSLAIKLMPSNPVRNEMHSYFKDFLSNFSKQNQFFWQSFCLLDASQQMVMKINIKHQTVHFGSKVMSLEKKKNLALLLSCFYQTDSLSAESICHSLWKLPFEDSTFHRLRMIVKRSNLEFEKQFGIEPVFSWQGSNIRCKCHFVLE